MVSVKTLIGLHDVCKKKNNVRNIFPSDFQALHIPSFYTLPVLIHCVFLSLIAAVLTYLLPILIQCHFLSTALSYPHWPVLTYNCQFLSKASSYPQLLVLTVSTANSYPLPLLIHCVVLSTLASSYV